MQYVTRKPFKKSNICVIARLNAALERGAPGNDYSMGQKRAI